MVDLHFSFSDLSPRHPYELDLLLVALSNGCMATYKLVLQDAEAALHFLDAAQLFSETSLVLSLTPNRNQEKTLITLSTGEVSVVDIPDGEMHIANTWRAHDLEVWCSAWKTNNVALTGGDDSLLKVWDLRDNTATQSMITRWYTLPFKFD